MKKDDIYYCHTNFNSDNKQFYQAGDKYYISLILDESALLIQTDNHSTFVSENRIGWVEIYELNDYFDTELVHKRKQKINSIIE